LVALTVLVLRTENDWLSASNERGVAGVPFKSVNGLLSTSKLIAPGLPEPLVFRIEKARVPAS
jgi:hypothetical protein